MRKVYCDYCGRQAEYVDSKVIYGKSYGMMYLCRNCMAYVGVHKGTDKPLGRLANAELRYWKKRAHAVFDPLWQRGRFRGHRNAAYGFVLVPQDRFEELVRAEAERDVLEVVILGNKSYNVDVVMAAIKKARNKVLLGKPEVEGDAQ